MPVVGLLSVELSVEFAVVPVETAVSEATELVSFSMVDSFILGRQIHRNALTMVAIAWNIFRVPLVQFVSYTDSVSLIRSSISLSILTARLPNCPSTLAGTHVLIPRFPLPGMKSRRDDIRVEYS